MRIDPNEMKENKAAQQAQERADAHLQKVKELRAKEREKKQNN